MNRYILAFEKHSDKGAVLWGRLANLRRVDNPPHTAQTGHLAPVGNRRAGYHPAPHSLPCRYLLRTSMVIAGLGFIASALILAQEPGGERVVVPARNTSSPRLVNVTNISNGSVTVKTYDGKDVIVESAESGSGDRRRDRARDNVGGLKRLNLPGGLDVEEENNVITVHGSSNSSVVVTVPVDTSLNLKTTNGEIRVDGVHGEIDVDDLNGSIALNNVSGTVVAHSLNGSVTAVMDRVDPAKPISFSTLNGTIDVTLPADLKANVKLKADRGDIYSDFDIKLDTNRQPTITQKNNTPDGRFRVQLDRTVTGTINGGGVEASFNTFNGRILIRQKK
jgi:Putative adhesin